MLKNDPDGVFNWIPNCPNSLENFTLSTARCFKPDLSICPGSSGYCKKVYSICRTSTGIISSFVRTEYVQGNECDGDCSP